VALLFGLIDFGFVFNQTLEIRSASREGARLAVVDNGCGSNACSSQTADQQRDALIAAARAKAFGLGNANLIKVSVTYTGTTVGIDALTFCLNYLTRSTTGMFQPVLNGTVLKSKAVMRLEQTPTFSQGTDTGGPGAASC
jgi:Flp pilus assembly protein TadG